MSSPSDLDRRLDRLEDAIGREPDRVDLWRAFLAGEITDEERREASTARPITGRLSNRGLNRWRKIVIASSTLNRTTGSSVKSVKVVIPDIADRRL